MLARIFFAALAAVSSVTYAAIPFHAQDVEKYSSAVAVPQDKARLRISLSHSASKNIGPIRIGNISACSSSACYRVDSPGYVNVSDTSAGRATTIADVIIPRATITQIYFSEITGSKVLFGSVSIGQALPLDSGFGSVDILIPLVKRSSANQEIFMPEVAVANYFHAERETVFYDPKVATKITLSRGTKLSLPANLLSKPIVFSIGIHDTGEKFPLVDIYPYVNFLGEGSLDVGPIARSATVLADSSVPTTPRVARSGDSPFKVESASTATLRQIVSLKKTAAIQANNVDIGSGEKSRTSSQNTVMSVQACADMLANPTNQQIIKDASRGNGVAHINWCQNIPPYVHIAYVNTQDPRIWFDIRYTIYNASVAPQSPFLSLKRINTFPSAIVRLNGFTWEGDRGILAGGYGSAKGHVFSKGYPLANNLALGGVYCNIGNCAPDLSQFTMMYSEGARTNPVFTEKIYTYDIPQSYKYNTISSSTSVVKNGNCTTDTKNDRWSAVGADYGQMLLISSTSDGRTTAAELCPLYKAFGINNALRMDGGGSPAMTIDNVVLNPLTGANALIYGDLRYIPIALSIGW